MDDIIVCSSPLKEHIQRLSTICKDSNLKVQSDKFEFAKKEAC